MGIDGLTSIICRFLVCSFAVLLLAGVGCSTDTKAETFFEETEGQEVEAIGPVPIYYDFEDI